MSASETELAQIRDEPYKPLEAYDVVGNLETTALVGRDDAIDWCCLPRVDSLSVFARLLDHRDGGHLTVGPTRPFEGTQAHVELMNVLQTRFRTSDGLVDRIEGEDGLPGTEGRFIVCSFWLVEAGRPEEAVTLFEDVCGFAGPLGLLAEELDAETGRHRGNFPQAFSHIGVLTSALSLAEHAGTDQSAPEQYPPRRVRDRTSTAYSGVEGALDRDSRDR